MKPPPVPLPPMPAKYRTFSLAPLAESDVEGLPVLRADAVNVRRDIYLFVDFVRRVGIKRSHRGNAIPKPAAAKLAKILSYAGEADRLEGHPWKLWSNAVSQLARHLGLVTFDDKGVYAGYSSSEPSFPDNDIRIDEKRWAAWLAATPVAKEKEILAALVAQTENELFHSPTLLDGGRFDMFGSAIGPASRMDLPRIRQALLEILAELPAGAWLPIKGLVCARRSLDEEDAMS